MKQLKKTLLTLVALLAVTTGAWATEFTSLKVGDVLHAGDVINTGTNYTFLNKYLDAGMQPATVVRANIGTDDITESETGAYYLIKGNNNFYYGTIYGDEVDYDGGHWPVTATSDGIVVTAINPGGYTELTFAVHEAEPSSGPEVTWTAASKTGSFTMPGGNVTLEPDYYPQATAAEGAVTAATDAKATTDAPLVTIDETKLTGAKKLMYYVSTDATAPAYDAEGWTDVLPTAENYTQAATLNVWYYPVGTDEGDDEATATYSDGDICATALTVSLGAAPTYAVTFADDLTEPTLWTASPATDVKKGQTVTVTYSGTKKVIGVKAEKKAAEKTWDGPIASEATASDYGKVVCAAGHLHDAKTAVPDGCTAVGILGKVTGDGHGLILALQDAAQQRWNTINGWTSVTTYAGTTLKVLPDDDARGTNLTSYTALGETAVSNWAVAQKSDYEAIFQNLGSTTGDSDGMTYDANVNAYITTGVGGTAISGMYWSATDRVDKPDFGWDFNNEYWNGDFRGNPYNLRPVLGF